jgi:hypothetical protein
MRSFTYLIFVAITFLCWGTYGPTLHHGQAGMGAEGQLSLLRPIICVGIAYFLIAVIFPVAVLLIKGEQGRWSISGFWWSFIAGALGAFGALGITLAFKFDGKPIFVMPLVFGCAPIMNTLVTMTMAKTFRQANVLFFIGIGMVALGAAGVLLTKPTMKKEADTTSLKKILPSDLVGDDRFLKPTPVTLFALTQKPVQESSGQAPSENGELNPSTPAAQDDSPENRQPELTVNQAETESISSIPSRTEKPGTVANAINRATNWFLVILGIAMTAVSWGAYGPVLHKGQAKMAGSRLRPFLCVGLAYFAIAVVIPYWMLLYYPEPGSWLDPSGWISSGMLWSLGAGALGAIGALGIIYAFNFGGKPLFVMPLVFGFAPVINTLVETTSKGLLSEIKPLFYPSLALVILGAVMVLVFAPKPGPAKPTADVK